MVELTALLSRNGTAIAMFLNFYVSHGSTVQRCFHEAAKKYYIYFIYTVFQKKTSTHIIGYKLRNSCPILIIFDTKIPHIIWHRKTA